MKRIEFIGGPAVGKSTIINGLLKERSFRDKWITVQEAKIKAAKQIKQNIFPSGTRWLLIFMLKSGLFGKKDIALASKILKDTEQAAINNNMSTYNDLFELMIKKISAEDKMEPWHKAKYIKFYFDIILNDAAMLDYFGINELVVYDEGIIHNNPGITDTIIYQEILKKNLENSKKINPAGVIYCRLPLDKYFERRKNRIEIGKGIFLDIDLNEEELNKLCAKSIDSAEKKAEALKQAGVPVLELDMTKTVEENTAEALNFIRTIS